MWGWRDARDANRLAFNALRQKFGNLPLIRMGIETADSSHFIETIRAGGVLLPNASD
jgi:hypothetical protein